MKKSLLTLALLGLAVSSQAQTIWSDNFESATTPALPTGWTQTSINSPGWKTTTGSPDWGGSIGYPAGYYYVPTHTKYAVVDAWNDSTVSKTAWNDLLASPTINLSSAANPYMSFDMFMLGVYTGTTSFATKENFQVLVSDNNGATWSVIDSVNYMDPWGTHYTSLAGHTSATTKVGFRYVCAYHFAGAAVDNISVFNAPTTDLSLTSISGGSAAVGASSSSYYAQTSAATTVGGTVYNFGATTVTSFNVNYTLNGGTVLSGSSGAVSVAPYTSYSFSGLPLTMGSSIGAQNLKMWVTVTGDANHGNDTSNGVINGTSFIPKKRVFFEEGTGAWCGYCVRGIVFMDSLWKTNYNDVSIVAVHDSSSGRPDGMANDNAATIAYDAYISPKIGGYPSCYVDRHYVTDPSNNIQYFNIMQNYFGFANLSISNITHTGSTLGLTVNVTPAINLSGDYRLALIVTEDNIHNVNDANGGFNQHNYYSYQINNQPLSGMGYNFQDSLGTIPATSMYFKFVDRTTVPNMGASPGGVSGSLPASMTAGTSYSYSFTGSTAATLGTNWIYKNLRATVVLIDNNSSSPTYNQVLNSVNTGIFPLTVENVNSGITTANIYPNPASQQATLSFSLENAGNVSVTVYNTLGQAVYTVPAQKMAQGANQMTIPVTNLASGVYNVTVSSETGSINQHLTVVR